MGAVQGLVQGPVNHEHDRSMGLSDVNHYKVRMYRNKKRQDLRYAKTSDNSFWFTEGYFRGRRNTYSHGTVYYVRYLEGKKYVLFS